MPQQSKATVDEAFALLEFALAAGRLAKLNLDDRCREFLKLVLARRDFSYASIWIRSSSIDREGPDDQFELLSSIPIRRTRCERLAASERIFGVLQGKPWHHIDSSAPDFISYLPDVSADEGSVCTFRLGDFGILRLYSESTKALKEEALARLYSVVEAFAMSIEAGLNEKLLQAEIEERHKIERVLLQSQKMEIVGKLVASVSHDFNNLLAVMQGSLDIEFFKNGNSFESMQNMQDAIDRGTELTRHLLNYSRSEEELEHKHSSLNVIIDDVLPLVNQALGQAIRLRADLKSDDYFVLTDPGFAKDAILNIALNARDAMPDGGEFAIETVVTTARDEALTLPDAPDAYIEISFTDTGIGMNQETTANAPKPFFTTKTMGNGLGLSTVREFMEKSGGGLSIESSPGEGTKVVLKFPAWHGCSDSIQSVSRSTIEDTDVGLNILIVEDSEVYLDIISDQLEHLGHRVAKAADGATGDELHQSNGAFDIVLTDIVLPNGYTGIDLAKEISVRKENQKFIFMTGYSPSTKDEIMEQFPEAQLLYKPFKLEALADAIASATRR